MPGLFLNTILRGLLSSMETTVDRNADTTDEDNGIQVYWAK